MIMRNFIKIGQSVAKISWICLGHIWTTTVSIWDLYHSAKFGYDRCSSFYMMNISIFRTFGWKMPIHPLQKIVFFPEI